MAAPVRIGPWNWLSTGVDAGEAAVGGEIETGAVGKSGCVDAGKAGIAETGAGMTDTSEMGADETRAVGARETEAGGAGNCVGAVRFCVGTLKDENK